MENKYVIFAMFVSFISYIFYDSSVREIKDDRYDALYSKSLKTDSIINEYKAKADSAYILSKKGFVKIDSSMKYINSHIDIIEEKTNIVVDSATINEALLWADSVSQYY